MIRELRCAGINQFAPVVPVDRADTRSGLFGTRGAALAWPHRPAVAFFVESRKKSQKPRANVIFMKHGALVLDAKAKLALGAFLSRFGQLLELACEGGTLWYFNVTNLVPCVDAAASVRDETGMITHEAFDESAVPAAPAVFKDPVMAPIRIYVNDAGCAEIERLVAQAGLVGIECGAPRAF